MEMSDQLHVIVALAPEKTSDAHWIGVHKFLVQLLSAVEKRKISCSNRESNPRSWRSSQ
jgi:hypothetical protein